MNDAQMLRLLWAPEVPAVPRPGPKSQLTLAMIVEAGIAVADDRDGPALSMRLVAHRLGCTPMALYSYVDGKETLLRLMYDAAHAAFTPPGGEQSASGVGTERDVQGWARALTDLYADHHWLAELSWARPVLGPHEQEVLESLLRRLQPLALTGAQDGTIASALLTLCRHTGRFIADARHAVRLTSKSDEGWWQEQSAALVTVAADFVERFPLSARTGSAMPDAEASDRVSHGYMERSARAQLERTVRLLIQGAETARDGGTDVG